MELRSHLQALLRNALDNAERGWAVFPIRPNDKRPAFPDHDAEHCNGRDLRCRREGAHVGWEPRATTDPDRIRRAWTTAPYNIGVACGPSGLVVIDLDTPKPDTVRPAEWEIEGVNDGSDVFALVCERAGQPMPLDTYTVTTGRGGTHLYFRHPDDGQPLLRNTSGPKGNGLGWLIDTRAHGGQVLGAGSIVNGKVYTVAHDAEPAPLPAWLAERLTPAPLPPQVPVTVVLGTGAGAAYLDKAIQAALDKITAAASDGTLNNTVYHASIRLGQFVASGALDAGQAEAMLLQAAVNAGHPAAGARRSIRSGFRAGAKRPCSLTGAAA
jgi:hypothetical protein